jgi:hypothetical protein
MSFKPIVTSDAPWLPSTNSASTHRRRAANRDASATGMTRLCGANPNQLAAAMNAKNMGLSNRCSQRVAARSTAFGSAWLAISVSTASTSPAASTMPTN